MQDTLPSIYTAVHCRVRHPKAFSSGKDLLGKNLKYPADETDETRQFPLNGAKDALNCCRLVSLEQKESVYFLSDSNDLVRHVAMELQNDDFVQADHCQIDQERPKLGQTSSMRPLRALASDVSEETSHLDRQKGGKYLPSHLCGFNGGGACEMCGTPCQ